jgi:hypothetical protein
MLIIEGERACRDLESERREEKIMVWGIKIKYLKYLNIYLCIFKIKKMGKKLFI